MSEKRKRMIDMKGEEERGREEEREKTGRINTTKPKAKSNLN